MKSINSVKIFNEIVDYRIWKTRYSRNLEKYKNIHKGKTCFIIGNGPSLNKMDLKPLAKYYTFGLNKIYLIEDRVDLNLSYLVAVNVDVLQQSVEKYNSLNIPMFLSYTNSKSLKLKNEKINYIFSTGGTTFSKDITNKISEGATVTFVAMQIAYYMGFEKVFLIGVDHNFKVEGKPYEIQKLKGEDINHFDVNYFKGQQWGLPNLVDSEKSFKNAKSVYELEGRSIFDATIDGKLKVYKKISFEQALKESTKK